eukprot:gene16074-22212_t
MPPPPPPPPPRKRTSNVPSRREALFAMGGLLVGGLGSTAFYNTQYDLSEESATKFFDAVLDDPELYQSFKDELLFRDYEEKVDVVDAALDRLSTPEAKFARSA